MGQRLVITVRSLGKDIAKIYYHWSAYSLNALEAAKRAKELLKGCLDYCLSSTYETMYALEQAQEMGFTDDELKQLGYGFMTGEE